MTRSSKRKPTRKATSKGKLKGGITGKGFVEGDPRINRTIPGPGRPPNRWLELLSGYEDDAVHVLGEAVKDARSARKATKDKAAVPVPNAAIAAADKILDRLHGRPKTPIELMEVDLSDFSDEELTAIKQLLRKALGSAAVTVRTDH